MSHQQQSSRITDLQTFREVLNADEAHLEEPVYHKMTDHQVHHEHLCHDSIQDIHS